MAYGTNKELCSTLPSTTFEKNKKVKRANLVTTWTPYGGNECIYGARLHARKWSWFYSKMPVRSKENVLKFYTFSFSSPIYISTETLKIAQLNKRRRKKLKVAQQSQFIPVFTQLLACRKCVHLVYFINRCLLNTNYYLPPSPQLSLWAYSKLPA